MKIKYYVLSSIPAILLLAVTSLFAVEIQVDVAQGRIPISPAIYGRNNNISDDSTKPMSAVTVTMYNDAGLRMTRDGGGNNSTKYNWRRKLSSHPDWYNNVYKHDWDFAARSVQQRLPQTNQMWTLQLLGKVASNTSNNFNDAAYNNSQWSPHCTDNWAGGGGPSTGNGNPVLYLMDWPADSTTAILDYWFKPVTSGGLGLDSTRFRYWNMDNEPEAWSGTHDDVLTDTISAETYIAKFVAVAKLARQKFPGIKIVGPVFTNEWQWWDWNDHFVGGLPWMQYFVKRISEEQAKAGLRLLDVVDFHCYASADTTAKDRSIVSQLHRIWYDTTYDWPWANGSKGYPSGWDEARKKQYIFVRMENWLTQYFGANHGIKISVSEMGIAGNLNNKMTAPLTSVWYASQLGIFADHGVELFTPWNWYTGQWETLHLFSRYAKSMRVQSASALDSTVSSYSSVNMNNDSLTVVLVNRDPSATQSAHVTLTNFTPKSGSFDMLELSGLPDNTETFVSHTSNALKKKSVTPSAGAFTLQLPAYSVTAVLLSGTSSNVSVLPAHSAISKLTKKNGDVAYYDLRGRKIYMTDKNCQFGKIGTAGIYFRIVDGEAKRVFVDRK